MKREPLTRADADALYHHAQDARERLAIALLLDTGVRVSEAAGLTDPDCDWQMRRLTVTGKRAQRRTLPMSPRLVELLSAWLAVHDRLPAARTLQAIVRRVATRAGIRRPVSPHVLRHTFAVFALQAGVTLPALQRLLGHAHLVTTAVYLNVAPEDAIRELEASQGRLTWSLYRDSARL